MADEVSAFPRGPGKVWSALRWSLQGIATAFRIESSFRLECYLLLLLGPLAFVLGATAVERALLFGSLLLVLSAELLNSAIEQVVDKISPEFAVFAGRAKDMGSAAVFFTMMNVIAVWGCLLLPRWM